jgi:hypothetical protein
MDKTINGTGDLRECVDDESSLEVQVVVDNLVAVGRGLLGLVAHGHIEWPGVPIRQPSNISVMLYILSF